jgi:hypothetical protein
MWIAYNISSKIRLFIVIVLALLIVVISSWHVHQHVFGCKYEDCRRKPFENNEIETYKSIFDEHGNRIKH